MALQLKLEVVQSDDLKTLRVTETTGIYNSVSNIGGFGSPNPTVGEVLTATIQFYKRASDGQLTAYNLVNVYPALPSQNNGFIDITGEDIGFGVGSTIGDGIYEIVYTVTGVSGAAFTYILTTNVYITGAIECCWKNMSLKVSQCKCGCDKLEDKFNDFTLNVRLLGSAISDQNDTVIQSYIDSLTNLCQSSGCGCGSSN